MGIMACLRGRDRAQVLLITALMVPILLGMTAVAVDVGNYADDKRNLQNAADAIALAAAKDMCTPNPAVCTNTTSAQATANSYATKNGINPTDMSVQFLGGNTAPKVRVTLAHPHRFAFMRVLGIDSKGVSVVAAAVRVSPGGVAGVVPFGVTQDTVDAAGSGNEVVLKYDAGGGQTGDYGAIDIDGTGASVYRADLKFGSPSMLCSVTQPQCVETTCQSGGAFPSACGENAPSCNGPVCDSEPGNMKGPTQDGVDLRINHTSAACDTFAEAFTPLGATADERALQDLLASRAAGGGGRLFSPPLVKKTSTPTPIPTNTPIPTSTKTPVPTNTPAPTNTPNGTSTPAPTSTATAAPTSTPASGGSGKYALNPDCNPWGAGACPSPDAGTALCSRRVIVVPIITSFSKGGKAEFSIKSFALMFLEGYGPNGCTGSDCEIKGVFVKADVSLTGIIGNYDPNSPVHMERLVE